MWYLHDELAESSLNWLITFQCCRDRDGPEVIGKYRYIIACDKETVELISRAMTGLQLDDEIYLGDVISIERTEQPPVTHPRLSDKESWSRILYKIGTDLQYIRFWYDFSLKRIIGFRLFYPDAI